MDSSSVRSRLRLILDSLVQNLEAGDIPALKIRARSKGNIVYNPTKKIWTLGPKETTKTCKTMGGSKEVLKLANLINYLILQIDEGKRSTLRDLYYYAMNWIEQSRFPEVSDSSHALEHLEVLTDLLREELGIVPDVSGSVFGPIVIKTKTRAGQRVIDCTKDVSEAGFAIPPRMEDYSIVSCEARFMIVIETGGMYTRLIDDKFDKIFNCGFIHTKGNSSRATRILIKRIHDGWKIPIFTFADCDPWGFHLMHNILSGSIKSVHLSQRLCTPEVIHIGLYPSQIIKYGLPTTKLTEREVLRIEELIRDPRYEEESDLIKELKLMKDMKQKAEQQALALKGLTFVTKTYLPEILVKYGFKPVSE